MCDCMSMYVMEGRGGLKVSETANLSVLESMQEFLYNVF